MYTIIPLTNFLTLYKVMYPQRILYIIFTCHLCSPNFKIRNLFIATIGCYIIQQTSSAGNRTANSFPSWCKQLLVLAFIKPRTNTVLISPLLSIILNGDNISDITTDSGVELLIFHRHMTVVVNSSPLLYDIVIYHILKFNTL